MIPMMCLYVSVGFIQQLMVNFGDSCYQQLRSISGVDAKKAWLLVCSLAKSIFWWLQRARVDGVEVLEPVNEVQ